VPGLVDVSIRTGFSFFLTSLSKPPPFTAMILGAALGAWAIPEPHSEQKVRQTSRPEPPLLMKVLVGPTMVTLSLGKIAERAKIYVRIVKEGW
jgi:hypothetical protein